MRSLLSLFVLVALCESARCQCDPEAQAELSAATDNLAYFGDSVALSGDVAVIGAPEDFFYQGTAFVFRATGGTWIEVQQLEPGSTFLISEFGRSCTMEGSVAVVGSPGSSFAAAGAGAAHVFVEAGGLWSEMNVLVAPDAAHVDRFGSAVALSGDTLVVGAELDDAPTLNSGSAYVFVRDGFPWIMQQKLTASDGSSDHHFGCSVAIDGDTIFVGADQYTYMGPSSGAVYVFTRTGTVWTEQQRIKGYNAAAGDAFGTAVAILGDTAVIGAPGRDDLGENAGAAYVLRSCNDSAWSHWKILLPPGGDIDEGFGHSVALGRGTLVVGAPDSDRAGAYSGAAYLYERIGATWGAGILLPPRTTSGQFGSAVAIDDDRAVIGAALVHNRGGAQVVAIGCSVGSAYCLGDGSGGACPCGNGSCQGEGCANSSGPGGVLLAGGSSSAAGDDLVLTAGNLLPALPALLFAGENAVHGGNGLPLGDGLRCAGTNVVRLGTAVPDSVGAATWGPGLGDSGGWAPGETRYFQCWYRDAAASPCGTGFNLTHGIEATFVP